MAVIVFYNFYPRLLINAMQFLRCLEIDDSGLTYLESYPQIQCWQSDHRFYLLTICLPNIVIWGLVAPSLLLFLTVKTKKREKNIKAIFRKKFLTSIFNSRELLGFITMDFREEFYYWENISYYIKFIVVTFIIASSQLHPASQGSLLILLFLFFFLLQERFKPYQHSFINNFKTFSYITTICTSAFAIMASAKASNSNQKTSYLVLLFFANFLFYFGWTYHFLKDTDVNEILRYLYRRFSFRAKFLTNKILIQSKKRE